MDCIPTALHRCRALADCTTAALCCVRFLTCPSVLVLSYMSAHLRKLPAQTLLSGHIRAGPKCPPFATPLALALARFVSYHEPER